MFTSFNLDIIFNKRLIDRCLAARAASKKSGMWLPQGLGGLSNPVALKDMSLEDFKIIQPALERPINARTLFPEYFRRLTYYNLIGPGCRDMHSINSTAVHASSPKLMQALDGITAASFEIFKVLEQTIRQEYSNANLYFATAEDTKATCLVATVDSNVDGPAPSNFVKDHYFYNELLGIHCDYSYVPIGLLEEAEIVTGTYLEVCNAEAGYKMHHSSSLPQGNHFYNFLQSLVSSYITPSLSLLEVKQRTWANFETLLKDNHARLLEVSRVFSNAVDSYIHGYKEYYNTKGFDLYFTTFDNTVGPTFWGTPQVSILPHNTFTVMEKGKETFSYAKFEAFVDRLNIDVAGGHEQLAKREYKESNG